MGLNTNELNCCLTYWLHSYSCTCSALLSPPSPLTSPPELLSSLPPLVQDALVTGRMRLVDTFKEFDKDGDNLLGAEELLKLIKKLVPGAGPAHARCGEV